MDPALLKEREAFKRRALANPVIEKRAKKPDSEAVSSKAKVAKKSKDDTAKTQRGIVLGSNFQFFNSYTLIVYAFVCKSSHSNLTVCLST